MIPIKNPQASYIRHKTEIDRAIQVVCHRGIYLNGPETETLENEFANWNGSVGAIAVSSGTDGLFLSLKSFDINHGHEVIMPAMAPLPVMSAIKMTGATPVVCDIDRETFGLSPYNLLLSERTRAIILIHPYGLPITAQVFDMAGVALIEDCSHAHGTGLGQKVGNVGSAGVFSCYPTKNLSAIGDAGLVVSNQPTLIQKIKTLRQYGSKLHWGINGRIDEIQAAILRVKLRYLDRENDRRRDIARVYDKELPSWITRQARGKHHSFHQYVMLLPSEISQDRFAKMMADRGVEVGFHYRVIPSEYANWCIKTGDLSVAYKIKDRIVSLPIYPEMTNSMVEQVIEAVNDILG